MASSIWHMRVSHRPPHPPKEKLHRPRRTRCILSTSRWREAVERCAGNTGDGSGSSSSLGAGSEGIPWASNRISIDCATCPLHTCQGQRFHARSAWRSGDCAADGLQAANPPLEPAIAPFPRFPILRKPTFDEVPGFGTSFGPIALVSARRAPAPRAGMPDAPVHKCGRLDLKPLGVEGEAEVSNAGELPWRLFSSSIFYLLPHVWRHPHDSRLQLARFKRSSRSPSRNT